MNEFHIASTSTIWKCADDHSINYTPNKNNIYMVIRDMDLNEPKLWKSACCDTRNTENVTSLSVLTPDQTCLHPPIQLVYWDDACNLKQNLNLHGCAGRIICPNTAPKQN